MNDTGLSSNSDKLLRQGMPEIWRTSLQRLRPQFDQLALADRHLAVRLVETPHFPSVPNAPEHEVRLSQLPRFGDTFRKRVGPLPLKHEYRPAKQLFSPTGVCQFRESPFYSITGAPIVNSAGEAFDFDPGAIRSLEFVATTDSFDQFRMLAGQAGKCANGLAPSDWNHLVDSFSLTERDDFKRWVWILFDLAWRRLRGSPLTTERHVGKKQPDGTFFHVPLTSLPAYRSGMLAKDSVTARIMAHLGATVPDPTEFWYSELANLGAMSASAIDVLLAEAERREADRNPDKEKPSNEDTPRLGGHRTDKENSKSVSKRPAKRRGRPPDTSAAKDRKVAQAWKSSGCKSYAEFARIKGLSEREVKRAVDRDRQRNNSNQNRVK